MLTSASSPLTMHSFYAAIISTSINSSFCCESISKYSIILIYFLLIYSYLWFSFWKKCVECLVQGHIFAEVSISLIINFVSFSITSSSILMSIAEIIQWKSISICSKISSLFSFVAVTDSFLCISSKSFLYIFKLFSPSLWSSVNKYCLF